MNSHNNNSLSIFFGACMGVVKYLSSIEMINSGLEILKVFVFGIIGGAGGLLGKIIVQKIILKIKQ